MKNLLAIVLCTIESASLYGQSLTVTSPDQSLVFSFSIDSTKDEQGRLFYSLTYKKNDVVLKSRLGIETADLPLWVSGFTMAGHSRKSVDETWKPVYGERSTVKDSYNECTIDLVRDKDTNSVMQVIVRMYDEGRRSAIVPREPLDIRYPHQR